jgi:hypothetical protein
MKYIRTSPQAGLEIIETATIFHPLSQCHYRRFTDHRIAIVDQGKAQVILGLRNTLSGVELTGLTDEQALLVQKETRLTSCTVQ